MANLRTDSSLSRRIVLAFLDFLNSVEPSPGVDLEALEVVKECLEDVFKLNQSSVDDQVQSGLLVEYFSSLNSNKQHEPHPDPSAPFADAPSTSSTRDANNANVSQLEGPVEEPHTLGEISTAGVLKDELFGQFFGALDKIHFFKTTLDGDEDQAQLDKATHHFHEAVLEMEKSGCPTINSSSLAETFKLHGNKAMQAKLYSEAIDLYTYAIALCENNAVFYCNRAAAYTQIQKYMEAIRDCCRSIEIDPNYSKAYSRLGLVYYAQGNYRDAIDKGFMKALQLDPNSDSIKENIRVAQLKLNETYRAERDQNAGSTSQNSHEPNGQPRGNSSNSSAPPPFSSIPFNASALPSDLANLFMNMAANVHQGQAPHERSNNDGETYSHDEPEIRMGTNINLNFGEIRPEELIGTMRSVMGMFSGPQPHQNQPEGNGDRGSTPH